MRYHHIFRFLTQKNAFALHQLFFLSIIHITTKRTAFCSLELMTDAAYEATERRYHHTTHAVNTQQQIFFFFFVTKFNPSDSIHESNDTTIERYRKSPIYSHTHKRLQRISLTQGCWWFNSTEYPIRIHRRHRHGTSFCILLSPSLEL